MQISVRQMAAQRCLTTVEASAVNHDQRDVVGGGIRNATIFVIKDRSSSVDRRDRHDGLRKVAVGRSVNGAFKCTCFSKTGLYAVNAHAVKQVTRESPAWVVCHRDVEGNACIIVGRKNIYLAQQLIRLPKPVSGSQGRRTGQDGTYW